MHTHVQQLSVTTSLMKIHQCFGSIQLSIVLLNLVLLNLVLLNLPGSGAAKQIH